jgi:hypothetical protein
MDPLRPFAGLIRTLWKANTSPTAREDSTARSFAPGTDQPQSDPTDALTEAGLHSRVRARLQQIGPSDPRRAREAFVETVLAGELGEDLLRDPAFGDVVTRVADQIGADPALGIQLQSILQALAEYPPAV